MIIFLLCYEKACSVPDQPFHLELLVTLPNHVPTGVALPFTRASLDEGRADVARLFSDQLKLTITLLHREEDRTCTEANVSGLLLLTDYFYRTKAENRCVAIFTSGKRRILGKFVLGWQRWDKFPIMIVACSGQMIIRDLARGKRFIMCSLLEYDGALNTALYHFSFLYRLEHFVVHKVSVKWREFQTVGENKILTKARKNHGEMKIVCILHQTIFWELEISYLINRDENPHWEIEDIFSITTILSLEANSNSSLL